MAFTYLHCIYQSKVEKLQIEQYYNIVSSLQKGWKGCKFDFCKILLGSQLKNNEDMSYISINNIYSKVSLRKKSGTNLEFEDEDHVIPLAFWIKFSFCPCSDAIKNQDQDNVDTRPNTAPITCFVEFLLLNLHNWREKLQQKLRKIGVYLVYNSTQLMNVISGNWDGWNCDSYSVWGRTRDPRIIIIRIHQKIWCKMHREQVSINVTTNTF